MNKLYYLPKRKFQSLKICVRCGDYYERDKPHQRVCKHCTEVSRSNMKSRKLNLSSDERNKIYNEEIKKLKEN